MMGTASAGTGRSQGGRARVLARIRRSFSRRGVPGTARMAVRWGLWRVSPPLFYRLSHIASSVHENLFDWRFGTDTRSTHELPVTDADAASRDQGNAYEATDTWSFGCIVRALQINPKEFAFVDLGCGKGKTLLLAARQHFAEVIGVEHSVSLTRLAERNVARYVRGRTGGPAIRCDLGDARGYPFPEHDLVVYIYNAFDGEVLAHVLERIRVTHERKGRRLYVVYANPVHAKVCDQCDFLDLIRIGEGFLMGEFRIYGNREATKA